MQYDDFLYLDMKKLILFTLLISSILFGQTQDELDRLALPEATSRLDQIFLRQLDENLAQNEALRDLALSTSLSVASSSTLSVKGKSSSLSKSTMTLTYDITDRVSKERLTSGTLTATATSGTVSCYYG